MSVHNLYTNTMHAADGPARQEEMMVQKIQRQTAAAAQKQQEMANQTVQISAAGRQALAAEA